MTATMILQLHGEGLWPAEIARRTGFTAAWVGRVIRAHGFEPHAGHALARADQNQDRIEKMVRMHRQGLTLVQIGDHFSITRERVRQLLKKQGITSAHGGASKRAEVKRQAKGVQQEAASIVRWGMPRAQALELRKAGVTRLYESQRNAARQRGIAWGLNLAQWWDVWQASGKWDQRGRGKGNYVMSRIKDSGGYVVGNVHIQLATENSLEAVNKWRGKTKANRGVFCPFPGSDRPYVARIGRKQIGRYASEQEAAQARANYIAANGLTLRDNGTVNLRRAA